MVRAQPAPNPCWAWILATMLLGLAVLADKIHVQPRTNETVLSQIIAGAATLGLLIVSLAITSVLALAANASFGGLPILTGLLARDNYLPHLFGVGCSRLVLAMACGPWPCSPEPYWWPWTATPTP